MARPQNIGIKAMEIYFPTQCVEQSELEKFDGVSQGKYTIGLGQTRMSFCDDREDIYSLALTTVSSLLDKYAIDPNSIGRLEVGTETLLDKSKSVKSVLMQLFEASGNHNIEGVDTVNACYGGTNALFNAFSWVESSAWDGRNAIVVAGDIALYKKGNARPTGGAGCVAMLVGPDAPLTLLPERGSYMAHAYDFYKADLTSEYPIVDGQYSLRSYAEALDNCYKNFSKRQATLHRSVNGTTVNGDAHESLEETPLDRFDYMCFHSPTCKTVAKSYARLLFNDYLSHPENPMFADVPAELKELDYKATLTDKTLEKTFGALTKKRFAGRVQPSTEVPTQCGNMYCASLFSSLASVLSNVPSSQLEGKRIGMFSYGSGIASSMFVFRVRGNVEEIVKKMDVNARLASRNVVPPQVYDEQCNLRERAHLKSDYTPAGSISNITKGSYYLTRVDDMFRRFYEVKT
ncbi:MAG: hypothetical protein Q9162_006122 [Coniocarpon cinnabarinum]